MRTGREMVRAVAAELGVDDLADGEVEALLELAAVAAHSSERFAAPLACFLVGRSRLDPADALLRVKSLPEADQGDGDAH